MFVNIAPGCAWITILLLIQCKLQPITDIATDYYYQLTYIELKSHWDLTLNIATD